MAEYLAGGQPADYLYDLVRDYPQRGGKAIRPALLLATCQAYGGSIEDGLGPAAALEMLHNAFLIHDDIEDGSGYRRGQPTLHLRHGTGLAINAGDALACIALQPLRDDGRLGARLSRQLLAEFTHLVRLTTEGQALELGWRRDNVVDLGPADYLALAGKKTCWYTTVAPLRMGALIGSRGTASLDALTRFGFHLGIAFQIRDDLLSIAEVDTRHGKDRLGDIREGKRTLMLVHLLSEVDGADRARLVGYLATPEAERTADDAERILDLMRRYRSIDFAQEYGSGITVAAYDAFEAAFVQAPPSLHLDFIRQIIPYMLARSR
jgi:geranylgeranyl diphosphate synthase type II